MFDLDPSLIILNDFGLITQHFVKYIYFLAVVIRAFLTKASTLGIYWGYI